MRIYVIGDSISIQYGPYLEAYLRGVMDCSRKGGIEEANRNLDNPQGANGGDSGMVLAYLRELRRTGGIPAELVLVNCGLHDIKTDITTGAKQVPLVQYEENLRAIVQEVGAMGRQLVWVRTTPCDERVHNNYKISFHRFAADCIAYNAAADRIMNAAGIPRIDLHTFTLNLGPDVFCDHAHFREPVREKQAAFIAGWLQAYSAGRSPRQ